LKIWRASRKPYSSGVTGEKTHRLRIGIHPNGNHFGAAALFCVIRSGIGENGLTATFMMTPFDFFGAVARKIS